MPEGRAPAGSADRHVEQPITISFAGYNRAWAAWIEDRLERRGRRVITQRWDVPPDRSLTELLQDLKLAPGPILIVLSEWYFQLGVRSYDEWNAALREVVVPDRDRFAAVLVTNASLPTATTVLAAADLNNSGADEAERRLLDRLDMLGQPLSRPAHARRGPRYPMATPEVWSGGVPRRNTRFTGREALLNDTYSLLQNAEPGAAVVTFHGMPGVGKTQLAAEYVYRFRLEYDVVWWASAETRAVCRRHLAELAPKLGLSTGADYGERLRAVRDSLRRGQPHAHWLLILDGADEPEQISDLVPTGPGHVLITSRNPRWRDHNSQTLEVPVYSRSESVAFIGRRAPRLSRDEAHQLAEALEDLPLLLDQTAGWLNDSEMSVAEYVRLLEHGPDHTAGRASPDFPAPFRNAWSILLDKLRETVPESVDLLRLCTFFAPGLIPVRLLREVPTHGFPSRIAEFLEDSERWTAAIDQLQRYSVIPQAFTETEEDETVPSGEPFYLHRMVHQIVREQMSDEDRRELVDVARRALAANPVNPEDRSQYARYERLVPHLKHADVLQSRDAGVQRLVLDSLRYMYHSGEYGAGIKLGKRAMEAWRELFGENHARIWDLTHHYANHLRAVGDYRGSEAINRVAVDYLRDHRPSGSLDYLRAVSGLAADLRALARYGEALQLGEWHVAMCQEHLSEGSLTTRRALNNHAVTLRLLGRYEEALSVDGRVTDDLRRLVAPSSLDALWSQLGRAVDLRLVGRYAEAESLLRDHAAECRRVLGERDRITLISEYNLALCLRRGGSSAAGMMLADVRERGERVLGETHPHTLGFISTHSCWGREYGSIDEARADSEAVVARYEAMLPEGHPFIAGTRSNHALILREVGEHGHARALAEQSLIDMTRVVGERHPWTLGCAINAATVRNRMGDLESAAELSDGTVRRATEFLGRTHPLTLSARVALADDLRVLRKLQQAEKIENEALSDLAQTLGRDHAHTVSARSRRRPYWDFDPLYT
ncbi:FxSxx-COOH system tetratricopeptide repeat protein [Streptomyces sp. MB09-02B]|uniref:FxSxx-COOH system tetratricopeptide repeat protein n=1 Tax=Streptomyces sp. MB09-02B TaxID=3028667 RepID=UPI0029B24E20|nr:FxSxx-COOH system tetratricopeptide repeat protein [Streptomyces sp. MB09-02B]MDX3642922.1 FxSxx-COOH system tetratricopeptide repeat protein [Streptomyces sp. MB09-02B]